jgi:hypothetical protein
VSFAETGDRYHCIFIFLDTVMDSKISTLLALALITTILELIAYGGTFIGKLLGFMAMLSWLEKKRMEGLNNTLV